jgi:hypothetical protein
MIHFLGGVDARWKLALLACRRAAKNRVFPSAAEAGRGTGRARARPNRPFMDSSTDKQPCAPTFRCISFLVVLYVADSHVFHKLADFGRAACTGASLDSGPCLSFHPSTLGFVAWDVCQLLCFTLSQPSQLVAFAPMNSNTTYAGVGNAGVQALQRSAWTGCCGVGAHNSLAAFGIPSASCLKSFLECSCARYCDLTT